MDDIIDQIAGPEDTEAEIEAAEKALEGEAEAEPTADAEKADDAPAPGEGEEDDAAPAKAEPEMVPLAALHESRDQTKSMRAELNETREKMTRMETLFTQMQTRSAGPAKGEEAPEIPSYEDDPDGHFQGTIAALQGKIDKLEADNGQRQQAAETGVQEQQLLDQYAGAVREYTKKQPDFQAAYEFLAESVGNELEARGYADPKQRSDALQFEEGRMVGMALQQGKDPAEALYNLAKLRGYMAKDAGGDGGGESDEDKLARLQKGQAAAVSLSGKGSTGKGAVTLEALAAMPDGPEFDAAWEKARTAGLLG